MKYCIYCGKSLNDVAQFCEFCGKKQLPADGVTLNSADAESGENTGEIKIIYVDSPRKEKRNETVQGEQIGGSSLLSNNSADELYMDEDTNESDNNASEKNIASKTINIAFDIAVISGLVLIILIFVFPAAAFFHSILMTCALVAFVMGTVYLITREKYKQGTSIAALIISLIVLIVIIYRFYKMSRLLELLIPTWNLSLIVGLTALSITMIGRSIKIFREKGIRQNLRQSGQLGRLIVALSISIIILLLVGGTLISMRTEIIKYLIREFSIIWVHEMK